jgi:hypothetical protein
MAPAAQEELQTADKPLEIFYIEMVEPQAHARYGKLQPGQVVPMPRDVAARFVAAGVGVQVRQDRYDQYIETRSRRATAQQNAFQALNDGHAMWDVSTYRDVLTAPEGGLRLAFERGIPLVNVHMLRDENGDPLPPDADIEDILDAREYLHPNMVAPLAAHDRSSVMGGGSMYREPITGPMPLHPMHRAMQERIRENERMAQNPLSAGYVAPDGTQANLSSPPPNGERATRANRRASARAPRVSRAGKAAAADMGLKQPEPPSPAQTGDAPTEEPKA